MTKSFEQLYDGWILNNEPLPNHFHMRILVFIFRKNCLHPLKSILIIENVSYDLTDREYNKIARKEYLQWFKKNKRKVPKKQREQLGYVIIDEYKWI